MCISNIYIYIYICIYVYAYKTNFGPEGRDRTPLSWSILSYPILSYPILSYPTVSVQNFMFVFAA